MEIQNQGITRSGDKVHYLPMSLKEHNPKQVAHLIDESSPELFSLMFGSQGIQNLTQLVQGSENRFSYHYIRVAQIADQVVGIAVMVPAEKLSVNTDLKALSYRQQLRLGKAYLVADSQVIVAFLRGLKQNSISREFCVD